MTYDRVEKLQKGEMTELPFHASMYSFLPKYNLQSRYAMFGLACVNGLLHLPEEKTEKSLNSLFPNIKPMTVKEVISFWKGK